MEHLIRINGVTMKEKRKALRIVLAIVLLVVVFSSVTQAQDAVAPKLEVRVEGIKSDKGGELGVAVFNSRTGYPIHIEHAYEAEWVEVQKRMETVDTVFDSLPAGEYAVSVLHDVNGNRILERSRLGFPKEGVGFSNDQKVRLSAPKFDKCKFTLSEGENKKIVIQLDYRED